VSELAQAESTSVSFPEAAGWWLAEAAEVARRQRHCAITIEVLADRFLVIGIGLGGRQPRLGKCELTFTCAAAMDTNMLVAAVLRVGRDLS
jgi:hypothetical protein